MEAGSLFLKSSSAHDVSLLKSQKNLICIKKFYHKHNTANSDGEGTAEINF